MPIGLLMDRDELGYIFRPTDYDTWMIDYIASERQKNKEKHAVRSQRTDPKQTDLEIHRKGVAAELAVARMLGVDVDSTIMISGDDGTDLKFKGRTIQVKYNEYFQYGDFRSYTPELGADVGFSCSPHPENKEWIVVLGWFTRQDFEWWKTEKNFGFGKRWVMLFESLRPVIEMLCYVDEEVNLRNLGMPQSEVRYTAGCAEF